MTREFEKCRKQICGRDITITSWCDSTSGVWSAAAPHYRHVFSREGEIPHGGSRDEAITMMVRLLNGHLAPAR
jgi:hypothetical protein